MCDPNHVALLAQKPHVIPAPTPERAYTPMYQITETTDSCFPMPDAGSIDRQQIDTMLDKIDYMVPQIVTLQDDKLEPGPKQNIHDGSYPLFKEYLRDPTIPLISLCPIPSVMPEDVRDLVQQIIDLRIAPERAAWALHYITKKNGMNDITSVLMDNELQKPINDPYFFKLCKQCYDHSILHHQQFLSWAISYLQMPTFQTFGHEIISTHSLFMQAISQYQALFTDELLAILLHQKTQVIQYLLLINSAAINQSKTTYPAACEFKKFLGVPLFKRRAKRIFEIITQTRLSYITQIRNILISSYPYIDPNKITQSVEKILVFSDKKTYNDLIIELIETLFWFDKDNAGISSVIVGLIETLNCKFPIKEFVQLLYDHHEDVTILTHLMAELQTIPGYFKLNELLTFIVNHKIAIEDPDCALKILYAIPNASQTRSSALEFINATLRLGGSTFDEELKPLLQSQSKDNIKPPEQIFIENIETAKNLPYFHRYFICLWMISKAKYFDIAAEVIFELDADTLFIQLFKRALEPENSPRKLQFKLSRDTLTHVEKSIPLIIRHDIFGQFASLVLKLAPGDPVMFDLAAFITDHYKDCATKEQITQLNDLSKTVKQTRVDGVRVRELFRRYSFLCSLHVFDAFHATDSARDFEIVFRSFIADLLRFPALKASTLIRFFVDFAASGCITRPSAFFVKATVGAVLQFGESDLSDGLGRILGEFLEGVFERGMYQPADFLHAALSDNKKRRGATSANAAPGYLVRVFLGIVERRPDLFTPSNCLSDSSVKGFFQVEPGLLASLLAQLREQPLPALSDDVLRVIDCSVPSQLGCAYFSLLPEELRVSNYEESFAYFRVHATPQNARFLALWLKYRPYYTSEFPVSMAAADKVATNAHAGHLAQSFAGLFEHLEVSDKRHDVFMNAWGFICQGDRSRGSSSTQIANSALQLVANLGRELTAGDLDFLHVPMLIASPSILEQLVEIMLQKDLAMPAASPSVVAAVSVFVAFAARGVTNLVILRRCLLKLLDCLGANADGKERGTEFVVDAFNYVMCATSGGSQAAQDDLHVAIREKYLILPQQIRDQLILNQPPGSFAAPKDPLYFDVQAEQPPPQMFMPPPFNPGPFNPEPTLPSTGFSSTMDGYDPMADEFNFYDL